MCHSFLSCPSQNPDVNQFSSEIKCKSTCLNETTPKSTQPNVEFELKDCFLLPKKGDCSEVKPRFYYDPDQSQCLEFKYSGCQGNKNNFLTYAECLNTCKGSEDKLSEKNVTVCEQPRQVS